MGRGGMSSAEKSMVWSARRSRQWGRFGGRLGKVWDKPTTTNVAKAAWSGVKYLRTLVNSEVHKFDVGVSTTTVSNAGQIIQLNAIAQGDTAAQRTGNSILAKYLAGKFTILASSAATQTLFRFILFIDRQQVSDTAPAVTDILSSASTMSFLNNSQAGRFQVLEDKLFTYDVLQKRTSLWKYYKSFAGSNLHVKFNGTAATDIQKNGIYMLLLSSEAVNQPQIIYSTRFGYHDN